MIKLTGWGVAACALFAAATAHAQGLRPTISQGAGAALQPNQLYAVETTCTAAAELPNIARSQGLSALLPANRKALTFYLSVQPDAITSTPALADQLRAAVLVAFAYSVDQSKQTAVNGIGPGGSCNRSALVYGQTALYVVPVALASTSLDPGGVFKAFDDAYKVVTKLAPVFGVAATATPIKKLGDVNDAATPISDLVTQLNPATSTSYADSQRLVVGDTLVTTPYATIKVTVRPVGTVVADPKLTYLPQLKTAAAAAVAGAAISTSDDGQLRTSCEAVASKLAAQGFTSNLDQDYGIVHAASPAITTPGQMLTCLGDDRAVEATGFRHDVMFEGVPDSHVPRDVQPSFSEIRGVMTLLMQQMGRYVKLAPPQPALAAAIGQNVAPTVSLSDPTVIFPSGTAAGLPQAIDFLAAQGYRHVGYFAQVTNAMDAWSEFNVNVGFVAIKGDGGATSGCYTDALAIYPRFKARTVAQLIVSPSVDEVKALVGSRAQGGFTLKDCPAASAAPTPAPSPTPTAH